MATPSSGSGNASGAKPSSGSSSSFSASTPSKGILKKTPTLSEGGTSGSRGTEESRVSAGEAKPINHDVNFQAVLPGYPPGYFMGILPSCPLGQMYPTDGYPDHDYTEQPHHSLNIPYKNSIYQPTTADPMCVTAMPWVAFPYGIPLALPKWLPPKVTPPPSTPPPKDASPQATPKQFTPVVEPRAVDASAAGELKGTVPLGFWSKA